MIDTKDKINKKVLNLSSKFIFKLCLIFTRGTNNHQYQYRCMQRIYNKKYYIIQALWWQKKKKEEEEEYVQNSFMDRFTHLDSVTYIYIYIQTAIQ